MFLHSLGYVFEGRYDINKTFGVKEEFSTLQNKDILTTKFIVGVDSQFNILIPAYNDVVQGFIPLKFENDEAIVQFVKSNKPTFIPVGSFAYILSVAVRFNVNTAEMTDLKIDAYILKSISNNFEQLKNYRGEQLPALVTDKVVFTDDVTRQGTNGVYNTIYVSDIIGAGIEMFCKKFLTLENCRDKGAFLKSRINLER